MWGAYATSNIFKQTYLNPLIPYLGKKYSVVPIGRLKNPSIVPNI